MSLKPWLAAIALATVVAPGPAARAGLFDRLRERAEARAEKADRDAAARDALGRESVSFAIADEREIGKIVTAASFQPLPAPGGLDQPLQPVPEPLPPGPASSFYPGTPGEPYPIESGPVPSYPPLGGPIADPGYPAGPMFEGVPLYPRVTYEDLDNVHPCGVPTIVQVLDPCENPCNTCGPRCVFVKICIPPNQPPRIKVEDHGRKIKYKYGEYQVEIESEDGVVSVDYDD